MRLAGSRKPPGAAADTGGLCEQPALVYAAPAWLTGATAVFPWLQLRRSEPHHPGCCQHTAGPCAAVPGTRLLAGRDPRLHRPAAAGAPPRAPGAGPVCGTTPAGAGAGGRAAPPAAAATRAPHAAAAGGGGCGDPTQPGCSRAAFHAWGRCRGGEPASLDGPCVRGSRGWGLRVDGALSPELPVVGGGQRAATAGSVLRLAAAFDWF